MLKRVLKTGVLFLSVLCAHAVEPVVSGDSARGARLFDQERCVQCHSVNGRGGKMGADFARLVNRSYTPAQFATTMWNHAPVMWGAMEAAGIRRATGRRTARQELTTEQPTDMQAWLRSLPETKGLESRFSNTSDRDGNRIFETKGCVNCHVGKLALEDRLHNMTLTDIAVDMWNHAPRMVKPTPTLSQEEMRELLSFLWMRQFVYPTGSAAKGKEIFQARRCADCHAGGTNGAPQLPGQARHYSEVSIISAIWGHGPQMLTRMKQAKIS